MTTSIEKNQLRSDLPEVHPGDKVKVYQHIKEGDKKRIAPFEGLVIARKHGHGVTATFTVRKVVDGIGIERIFPLHLPTIQKIDILSRSKVRRAKLYYIRDKAAREVRRKMRTLRKEAEVVKTPAIETANEGTKTAE
ncbi:MAG: 50S ribosomal protein L19 [bacterium]|nr:50S ribosomal protein L19 [bacterium]